MAAAPGLGEKPHCQPLHLHLHLHLHLLLLLLLLLRQTQDPGTPKAAAHRHQHQSPRLGHQPPTQYHHLHQAGRHCY